MPRRVVITGVGAVSALGVGATPLWEGLCAGRRAIGPLKRFDASGFRANSFGEVAELSIKDFVPKHYRKATKVMARDIELAVVAAKLAVEDAGLVTRGTLEEGTTTPLTYPSERMGCHIGAGLIAAESEEMAAAMATARTGENQSFSIRAWGGEGGGGMEALTPLWLLKYLPNMLACHVTIIHGAEGPSNTITCGEASGLLSIGESTRVILRGAADLCFSGGAESKLNPMGILRMDLAGYLAPASAGPDAARPFAASPGKDAGTILGEGGGILVLEEAGTAKARGRSVYAEVVGFGGGHSSFGYPAGENDEGYLGAIENALEDAKIRPEQVSAVVPLGAGVPSLDRAEMGALRRVFGDRLKSLPIVTHTPNVGMSMAGAGGLQAAIAAMCLKHQALPPSSALAGGGRVGGSAKLDYVLACSGSLGAQNAAIVLKAAV